jgi:hypothetical protein
MRFEPGISPMLFFHHAPLRLSFEFDWPAQPVNGGTADIAESLLNGRRTPGCKLRLLTQEP